MNYNLGITLKICNLILFTTVSLLFFSLGSTLPTFQVFFLIALFALFCMIPWLFITKFKKLQITSIKTYVFRSWFNIGGMVSWLEALKTISPNDATAISYMTPIFTTVLAILFCNERLSYRCLFAIFISMIGTYIIMSPKGTNLISEGGMIALFATFMWACYDIMCKLQTTTEDTFAQTFYTFLFTSIFSLPIAVSIWEPVDLTQLDNIALMGMLSAINVTVLFLAYKHAPITILMPFSFSRLIFMALAMFILFDEIISGRTMIGVLLIILAITYIFILQQKGKIVV